MKWWQLKIPYLYSGLSQRVAPSIFRVGNPQKSPDCLGPIRLFYQKWEYLLVFLQRHKKEFQDIYCERLASECVQTYMELTSKQK